MRVLTRRTGATILVTGLVFSGVTACGKSSTSGTKSQSKSQIAANPQGALATALTSLQASKNGTVTVKFAATKEQILAFAKASKTAKGESVTAKDDALAGYLADGSITVKVDKGAVDVAVNLGTSSIIEIQSSAVGDLYIKLDVARIATLAGQSPAKLSAMAGALPPQFAFVKDAIAGKWLKIDGAALKSLASLAKSRLGASAAPSAVSSQQALQLQAALVALIKNNFTATDAGSDPKGEHLLLKGNTKQLATAFATFAASLPGGTALAGKADLSKVPNKDLVLDAFINSSGLAALQLDLAQFANPAAVGSNHFPLEIGFSATPVTITAPSGAVTVDINSLLGQLLSGGGLGSLLGGASKP